jgi:hypothetical protein
VLVDMDYSDIIGGSKKDADGFLRQAEKYYQIGLASKAKGHLEHFRCMAVQAYQYAALATDGPIVFRAQYWAKAAWYALKAGEVTSAEKAIEAALASKPDKRTLRQIEEDLLPALQDLR